MAVKKQVNFKVPAPLYEQMGAQMKEEGYETVSEYLIACIHDHLNRAEFKRDQAKAILEFMKSDEGFRIVGEMLDDILIKRATPKK